MFTAIYKAHEHILKTTKADELANLEPNDIVWVDLHKATEAERKQVELLFEINLDNFELALEMEKVSKYIETQDSIILNSTYLLAKSGEYDELTATQILKNQTLISCRSEELKSFGETRKRIESNQKSFSDGYNVLLTIFEVRIDLNANLLQTLAREVELLGKEITANSTPNEKILLDITALQEKTMVIRENLIDYQRLISAMLKSDRFPGSCNERLRILIKDIGSLIQQIEFSFERLAYLQNTIMGLINLAQNNTIKIFTIISVIFMPPTLIASWYGMNFKMMPELQWAFGYPFAIGLMIFSSIMTLTIFRWNRWL
jgi:magnesium transporter